MARARKKTAKRKAPRKRSRGSRAIRKRVRAIGVAPPAVPRRRKGESLVAYHDRLSDMIYEATRAGDLDLSAALQAKAGELAAKQTSIHRPRRGKSQTRARRGPGTYPWDQCIDDQMEQYGSVDRAKRVCGRIRASSREKYPIYWSIRGTGKRRNPDNPGDYAIVASQDETGWHWWASDERAMKPAAASTKPAPDEESAIRAAKRAIRRYDERAHPAKKTASKGKKTKTAKAGRRSVASILRRL